MSNNKRIVFNGLIMYVRMLIMMMITLYISKLAITILGVDLFGLFSVVSGVVILGGAFTSILEMATQRFIALSLVQKNTSNVSATIQNCITVHIFLAVISLILIELLGGWYIGNKLIHNDVDITLIYMVFHLSIATFMINVLFSPIMSIFVSHEKASLYTTITIVDVLLRLALILTIKYWPGDVFINYAVSIFISCIVSKIVAVIFIYKYFKFYKYKPIFDMARIKNIFSFILWNFFGGVATISSNQGVNLIINLFFGLTVNASRTIAMQISSAITQVLSSIQLAINPQINKSYAKNDYDYLFQLVITSSKLTSILAIFVIICLSRNIDYILTLWLGSYPEYLLYFVYFILIEVYINSFSGSLVALIQSTGNIKKYQLIVGGTMMLNLPLCYFFFQKVNDPFFIYYVSIFISIICQGMRVYFSSLIFNLKIRLYLVNVVLRSFMVLVISIMLQMLFFKNSCNVYDFFLSAIFGLISVSFIAYVFGLDSSERKSVRNLLSNIYSHTQKIE